METGKWQKVKDVFLEVLEKPQKERADFLAKICGDDFELRAEAEKLLAAHFEAESFIEKPVFEVATVFKSNGGAQTEKRFGHYKIIREIGAGGMGVVFLAERDDGEFSQQVAVKIVRQTLADSELINRFKRERQILALLNHPNIANLLDGGIGENGLPFLAMEYVEGEPITTFVERENLSVEDRLKLFLKVCAGVAHAHRNLIVHRDIKPSNVFVTGDGNPKLLDFGLAKLLSDSLDHEATPEQSILRAMTPAYASPEQMRGEKITTASDIYSLGVLLYELLSGERPFHLKNQNFDEAMRVVCESEPTLPSDAVTDRHNYTTGEIGGGQTADERDYKSRVANHNPQKLRGDLDNIVLTAMRKEPERRYPTVEKFAEDIERHLQGLPVRARPNTFSYRAEKFIKRNRLSVAAGLLIIFSLLGGIAATVWQARRAEAQKARAENRFNDVRKLSNSLMFEIHDSVKDLQGSTPTRQLIVSRALEYLDSLAQESGDDSSLQRELATAYEKIGDIQGNPYSANLGDTNGALDSYGKAVAIREALRGTQKTTETEMEIGRAFRGLGDILEAKGNQAESIENYRRSLRIFQQLAIEKPNDAAVEDELGRAYDTLGDGFGHTENTSEKLQSYQKALEIRQKLLAQNPSDAKQKRSTAVAFLKVGGASALINKAEAVENLRRGTEMMEALSAREPNSAKARREVGFAYFLTGNAMIEAKDYPAALASRLKAFEIRRKSAEQDAKNQQAQFDFAAAYADLGEAYTETGEPAKGFEQAKKALEILETLSASDPTDAVYQRNIGYCYERMAQAKERLAANQTPTGARVKEWMEATDLYQKALNVFSDLQSKKTLIPADAGKIEKLRAKISECQNAVN
ncbi:MAG: serine/threonine protein kinase [Acidobacteria bacterium]|nr:serine/threonine protein kinase [Acidobacteriota bacterium]